MRRTLVVMFSAALVGMGAAATVSTNAFGVLTCTGIVVGNVNQNVTVPSGQTCQMPGITVTGNITIQAGGRLAVGDSTINGNIYAPDGPGTDSTTFAAPFSVVVCGSKVTGSITIWKSTSEVTVGGVNTALGTCDGNFIGKNLWLAGNAGDVDLGGNGGACVAPGGLCKIGGSATVTNSGGPTTVINNAVTGNLNCSGNGTMTASGNTAARKNGQCA